MTETNPQVTFKGSFGEQFGRNLYTTSMSFKSLDRFLTVFPEVQRKLNRSRVKAIAEYVLSGLAFNDPRFLSAITSSCRGEIMYNATRNEVSIDINAKLSINDGQHRYNGIKHAISELNKQIKKAEDDEQKNILLQRLDTLENMHIPVVIFDNMDQNQEQQIFHDLNYLAQRPTKSVSLKFDNTDLYNNLAKDLMKENKYLVKYGVETEKTMLRKENDKIMVLSTLRNMISYLLNGKVVSAENNLSDDEYSTLKAKVSDTLDLLFSSLPADFNNKEKYIFNSAVVFQGLSLYTYRLTVENKPLSSYLAGLSQIDWTHSVFWDGNGGQYDKEKKKVVFNGTGSGVKGVCEAMVKYNEPVDEKAI